MMVVGVLLLVVAATIVAGNLHAEQHASAYTQQVRETMLQDILSSPPLPQVSGTEMKSVQISGQAYIGLLDIPSLQLSLPVCRELNDTAMQTSVCRYSGSYLTDDMIVGGHNYRCHFGTLSQISVGDAVHFTDVDGIVYEYTVVTIEQLSGNAVQQLPWEKPGVTLFTCDYTGEQRLVVRCNRVNDAAVAPEATA